MVGWRERQALRTGGGDSSTAPPARSEGGSRGVTQDGLSQQSRDDLDPPRADRGPRRDEVHMHIAVTDHILPLSLLHRIVCSQLQRQVTMKFCRVLYHSHRNR